MEEVDITQINSPVPLSALLVDDSPPDAAIRMRALRRKARRVSAYARFNVDMLNALAAEVETDIAGLQH